MNVLAIYVDVLFMKELLIDGALLLVTAWVRGIRAVWYRILGAGAIGALYVALLFVPPLSFLYTFVFKFGISLMMLFVAFGFGGLRAYGRNLAAFYAINFIAAGAVLGFYYLIMQQGSLALWHGLQFIEGGVRTEFKTGFIFVGSTACIGLYIARSVVVQRREKALIRAHVAQIKVTIEDREYECEGLIDTGNQLYDPLTRTPVTIIEASLLEADLPSTWLKRIRESEVDKLIVGDSEETFVWQDRLRLVPYRGVNRGTQFMLALKPDAVTVQFNGDTIVTRKALVGLDGGQLSSDRAYRAVIHPSMAERSGGA
ncbi:sigma-E processing peptidase SpoIIGA [Paenibacillus curdlanolyticus YK9]|uniref:Sigma-E processing peptidase SpoIIGA n=1 Tax=Paenibacillus curdlanolyticus YK9 TaxID=717606 RepID=E0I3G2_9BACL|nr:sigma-E processing peptidase SpoIIGA [Paenibacillus curdlanolyticus]EFM12826.1 sigma-E processing peptidase SpoIIGA [Paenibacillus curdlanolyticus YK9]